MKYDFNNNFVPYRVDGEKTEEFYSRLRIFSWEIFSTASIYFDEIISMSLQHTAKSEVKRKETLIQLLTIGVFINCHSKKGIFYRENLISKGVCQEKNISPLFDSEELINMQIDFALDFSLDDLKELIDYIKNTGEYAYEVPILEKWHKYWTDCNDKKFSTDICKVLLFTDLFIDGSQKYIGQYFNNEFFNRQVNIDPRREDYFQVTKTKPEYFLNAISAMWMIDINREIFDSMPIKKVMVPGCMRPENGRNCQARHDGAYLQCSGCNNICNINKLRQTGQKKGFDVMIVLHQSTFKVDYEQLRGTGIVGVACMSCLLSGGLMLQEKGIKPLCVMLNKPGCKKHWTADGISTDIDYDELFRVLGIFIDGIDEGKLSA